MNNFKVARVFSDNMVLQREKPVCVFGEGKDEALVIAEIDGETRSARILGGRWLIKLPPHKAGTGYTLTVSCEEESLSFSNIAYGEVWLAGGQSNMEMELQSCAESDVLKTDNKKNVRFYYTPKRTLYDEDFIYCEEHSRWEEFSSETARTWSAVGYFFAQSLAEKLGVTVGIIGCNWGGSSASCWIDRETLEKDDDLREYLNDIEKSSKDKTDSELKEEWLEYRRRSDEWYNKSLEFYASKPDGSLAELQKYAGKNPFPGPLIKYNPMSAAVIYESMLKRISPYTLSGFIYYQGESDTHRPNVYYKLFRELIELWRSAWGDSSLPFIFVQLPMYGCEGEEDKKDWCLIREAQMNIFKTIRNTGIAVALDKGEFNEIHPKSKKPIGERLALQALYEAYGFENLKKQAFSPIFKDFELREGGILLYFDYSFGFKSEGEPKGFELSGADKKFFPALAEFRDDKIFLSSPEVKDPIYARYCWTNYGPVNVFSKNGLPLAPFRTYSDKL